MKILCMKKSRKFGSRFEALGVLGSKSWRKQTLIFFQKKLGYVFYNFLIWALLRPQIAIRRRATISRANFSRFGLLQIRISDKILLGHNPLGIVNHIVFLNVKNWQKELQNVIISYFSRLSLMLKMANALLAEIYS